jgi:hypothetical protein
VGFVLVELVIALLVKHQLELGRSLFYERSVTIAGEKKTEWFTSVNGSEKYA